MGLPKTLLVSERGQKKDKTIPAGIAFMCRSIMCAVEGFDLGGLPALVVASVNKGERCSHSA